MTKEWAKENWHILEAFRDGKVIEWRYSKSSNNDWVEFPWNGASPTYFDSKQYQYRIKPEPKLRPWRPEEVPMYAMFRSKKFSETRSLCVTVWPNGCRLQDNSANPPSTTFVRLLEAHEHSLDNGKTWLPCGAME